MLAAPDPLVHPQSRGTAGGRPGWHDDGVAGVWQDELGPRSAPGREQGRDTDAAARGARGLRRVRPASALLTRWVADRSADNGGPARVSTPTGQVPALVLAGLGAAAFAVSLILEWQHVSVVKSSDTGQVLTGTDMHVEAAAYVGDLDLFGTVYLVAVIGLLAAAGLATSRADLAARLRYPLAGGGLGVLAMLVAVAVRASAQRLDTKPSPLDGLSVTYMMNSDGSVLSSDSSVIYTMTLGAGLVFAFAAVLLPLGAVWLAARQTPRAYPAPAADPAEPDDLDIDEPDDVVDTAGPASWRPTDPYDLTVTSG